LNVGVWKLLGNNGRRDLFWLASAMGSVTDGNGFRPLGHGVSEPIASCLSPRRQGLVRAEAGVGVRAWQIAVRSWSAKGLAHRCRNGWVSLFLKAPLSDGQTCLNPECQANLTFANATFAVKRTSGSPRANATFASEGPKSPPELLEQPVPIGVLTEWRVRGVLEPEETAEEAVEEHEELDSTHASRVKPIDDCRRRGHDYVEGFCSRCDKEAWPEPEGRWVSFAG
jgi:hypothetical protein